MLHSAFMFLSPIPPPQSNRLLLPLHLRFFWYALLGGQARVGVLLLALLFFNNAFFGLQIFSPFPRFFFR